jgi:hypothetical protein
MTAHYRWLAQKSRTSLIESLGEGQKNLSMSRCEGLVVSDHGAIEMI